MDLVLAYSISVISVIFTSIMGSYYTSTSVKSKWYQCIQPSITPPPIVFPIVWTLLYIMIAIAFGMVLSMDSINIMVVLLFAVNLLMNILWCYLYFRKKELAFALVNIIGILLSIVSIIALTEDLTVQLLLIPYLLWITFATILNVLSLKESTKCREIV